mgnify:FL=1
MTLSSKRILSLSALQIKTRELNVLLTYYLRCSFSLGIRDVLMNLGLLYTNRHTKNIDFSKAIEGIAGAEVGFKLIYDLAKMVDKSQTALEKNQITSPVETLSKIAQSKVR